jgi:tetratricopeptide (TPR) repeat protein
MKTRILSCCIAALTFVACDDPTPPVVIRPPVVKQVVAVAPAPVVTPVPAQKIEEPADVLAVKHDQPGVDHLARARQLASDGDRGGAFTEARRALYTAPTDEEALDLTAKLAQKIGNHALAAEAFGRIAGQKLEDAGPCVQQARELVKARQYDQAVIAGKEAVSRDSGNPEGYQAAGLGHLGNGELSQAIVMFSKVIDLKPDHGWALNNLGLAYLRANENDKAVEVLTHAAELLPNTAYVHNNLGVALERVGRTDEAKQAYLTATNLSPKYVKARLNAARVAKAGDIEEPAISEGNDSRAAAAEPSHETDAADDGTMSDLPHPKSETNP